MTAKKMRKLEFVTTVYVTDDFTNSQVKEHIKSTFGSYTYRRPYHMDPSLYVKNMKFTTTKKSKGK